MYTKREFQNKMTSLKHSLQGTRSDVAKTTIKTTDECFRQFDPVLADKVKQMVAVQTEVLEYIESKTDNG